MQVAEKQNPIQYSIPLVLLLTVCLLFAEHGSARQMHGNIDLDFIISKQSGRLSRQVAYVLLGLIGMLGLSGARKWGRPAMVWNPRITVILGLLLSWSAASLLWTDAPGTTARRLFVIGLTFLGAIGLTVSWNRTEVLKFIAISAALQVSVGVFAEIMYGYFTPLDPSYRFAGTLPWNSQGYLCLALTLAGLALAKQNGSRRWLYRAMTAYGFVALLLTRSRGALSAIAVALIVFWLVSTDLKQKAATVLACGTITTLLIMSSVAPRLLNVLNRGGEGGSDFTGRGPLWTELMSYVDRRPWTGYGYEAFWTETTIDDVSGDQKWAIDTAHSGYMEGILMLGVIGLSLHTLVLVAGSVEGIRLFLTTHDLAFLLAAGFCCVYLTGGILEALWILKTSQSSFYFAMLLCLMARIPGGEKASSSAKAIRPQGKLFRELDGTRPAEVIGRQP